MTIDVVAELVHGHVLADLAEAAERDDAQRVAHRAECTGVPGRCTAGAPP